MARVVGIDLRKEHVRAALIRTSLRRVTLEGLQEIDVSAVPDLETAIRAVALSMTQQAEAIAVSIEGELSFVHRIPLPATALKQLDEVLPFEIEAAVPVDVDALVYDHALLRGEPKSEKRTVLVGAARKADAQKLVELVKRSLGREPERVGCGPVSLANLAAVSKPLGAAEPTAVVDLGAEHTEVVILSHGEPVFARTLSRGVAGLPATAASLAAELRQTFAGWVAHGGDPVAGVWLVGGGAASPGASEYLTAELGIVVQGLYSLELEYADPSLADYVPRYAKAIALALGAAGRAHDLDLRRGSLGHTRGFSFIKEKVPLLAGLASAIAISFAFASFAEYRSLARQNEVLTSALAELSKNVLGEETSDPARVDELLTGGVAKGDTDPMPHFDAFDVMVEISNAVPSAVVHDIEELDVQRGHIKIYGVVGTTDEAQGIAGALKVHRCVDDLKISKITKAIQNDRQKYVLEFDAACPEDATKKKKKGEGKPKEAG